MTTIRPRCNNAVPGKLGGSCLGVPTVELGCDGRAFMRVRGLIAIAGASPVRPRV